MSIRDWFYHRHYWGIPHKRAADNRMIQICYECGKEREVRMELAPVDDYDGDTDAEDIRLGEEDDKRFARSLTGCYV
ncbi:MAG TPA: hypothetical protein VF762_06690 [Blastocatellia bacterium]|jgi:hypothetical protein